MTTYNDYPLEDLYKRSNEIIAAGKGTTRVHFKWTCQACGERVTAETPNVIYRTAEHNDCLVQPGFVTNTQETGGNYVIMQAGTPEDFAIMDELLGTPPKLMITMDSMGVVDGSVQEETLKRL